MCKVKYDYRNNLNAERQVFVPTPTQVVFYKNNAELWNIGHLISVDCLPM